MWNHKAIPWQIREKHEKECREILKAHHCIDSQGRILGSNPEVRQALFDAGHTFLDINKCQCSANYF